MFEFFKNMFVVFICRILVKLLIKYFKKLIFVNLNENILIIFLDVEYIEIIFF